MEAATMTPTERRKEALRRAGLSENSELTHDQAARAMEAPLDKSEATIRKFIMQGANGKKPAAEKDPNTELGKKATELAGQNGKKLGAPITGKQAGKVKQLLAKKSNPGVAVLREASEAELQKFALGGSRADLPDELKEALRAFGKAADDRRIWPRKIAALILVLRSK